eukprot:1550293-Prorocentrum_lima.AAC.1
MGAAFVAKVGDRVAELEQIGRERLSTAVGNGQYVHPGQVDRSRSPVAGAAATVENGVYPSVA